MAWFNKYESISKKNKWKKIASEAEKRREAKRLLEEEERKRNDEKSGLFSNSLEEMLLWARQNKRLTGKNEFKGTPTATATPSVPLRRTTDIPSKHYPEVQPIAQPIPLPYDEEADRFDWGKYEFERVEEEKRKHKVDFRNVEQELMKRYNQKRFDDFTDNLGFDPVYNEAYKLILSPSSTIPLTTFLDEEGTHDYIADVRAGNFDRIKELTPGSPIAKRIMDSARFFYQTKMSEPEGTPEGMSFAPSLSEFLEFSPTDLVNQYKDENDYILDTAGRKFFLPDEEERELAVWGLNPEKRVQFAYEFIQAQNDKIEEGRFDELIAVPVLGVLFEEELKNLLDRAINERRVLTDEEKEAALFYSFAAGFPKLPLTPEQEEMLHALRDEVEGPYKTETQYLGKGRDFGVAGDILGVAGEGIEAAAGVGAEGLKLIDPGMTLQGQRISREEDPRNELEKDILEEQGLLRGELPPDFMSMLSRGATSGRGYGFLFLAEKAMEAFEGGEKISRPVAKEILKVVSFVVERRIRGIEAAVSTPAVIAEKAGVEPEAEIPSMVPVIGGMKAPILPDIRGKISEPAKDTIEGAVAEFVLTELLNPANILFAIPFIGPGSRFARALQAGNKALAIGILADEFALTGNSPAIVRGALRGVSYVSRVGLKNTLAKFPALRNNHLFIKLMSGLTEAQIKRNRAHRVEAISARNLHIAERNRLLKLIREEKDFPAGRYSPELIKEVNEQNAKIDSYSAAYGRVGVPKTEGERMTIDAIRHGTWMGDGFPSGRPLLTSIGEGRIVDSVVTNAPPLRLRIAASGADEAEDVFESSYRNLNEDELARRQDEIEAEIYNLEQRGGHEDRIEELVQEVDYVESRLTQLEISRFFDETENLGDDIEAIFDASVKLEDLYDDETLYLLEGVEGIERLQERFSEVFEVVSKKLRKALTDLSVSREAGFYTDFKNLSDDELLKRAREIENEREYSLFFIGKEDDPFIALRDTLTKAQEEVGLEIGARNLQEPEDELGVSIIKTTIDETGATRDPTSGIAFPEDNAFGKFEKPDRLYLDVGEGQRVVRFSKIELVVSPEGGDISLDIFNRTPPIKKIINGVEVDVIPPDIRGIKLIKKYIAQLRKLNPDKDIYGAMENQKLKEVLLRAGFEEADKYDTIVLKAGKVADFFDTPKYFENLDEAMEQATKQMDKYEVEDIPKMTDRELYETYFRNVDAREQYQEALINMQEAKFLKIGTKVAREAYEKAVKDIKDLAQRVTKLDEALEAEIRSRGLVEEARTALKKMGIEDRTLARRFRGSTDEELLEIHRKLDEELRVAAADDAPQPVLNQLDSQLTEIEKEIARRNRLKAPTDLSSLTDEQLGALSDEELMRGLQEYIENNVAPDARILEELYRRGIAKRLEWVDVDIDETRGFDFLNMVVEEEALSDEELRFVEDVISDPTRKPFGSGFILEAFTKTDNEYDNLVAQVVKRTKEVSEETGRKFYVGERYDNVSGGRVFSVFGIDRQANELIRNNTVGLPTNPEDFVKHIDENYVIGEQKQFVDALFDLGKPANEIAEMPVERGINRILEGLVEDVNRLGSDTSKMATKEGRTEYSKAHKQLIQTIAYKSGRNTFNLPEKLTERLGAAYDEVEILLGNNGFLSSSGRFYDLGDDSLVEAAETIWNKSIDETSEAIFPSSVSDEDILAGIVTRFFDEAGVIGITRQGNDKLVVEAINYIDETQAASIRRMLDEGDIKEVSFSFDSAHGIREKPVLYRGPVNEEFDRVLRESTGVCAL